MVLSEQNILHYLLFRGLVKGDDLLNADTTVKRSSSRNRNFIVNAASTGECYFIKQSETFLTEQIKTLKSEANFYWLIQNDPVFQPLREISCRYFDYNPMFNILCIEASKESFDVYELISREGEISFDISSQAGKCMAISHNIRYDSIRDQKQDALFSKQIPWVFKIEKDRKSYFFDTSPATRQLIDLVNKYTDYLQLINKNKDRWETHSLIHGDIKFPNFLIFKNDEGNDTLRLIDWEIFDFGDPAWDVAGLFMSYLTYWTDRFDADEIKLTSLKKSSVQFWKSYMEGMKTHINDQREFLDKCISFAAIRMIQTCYEMATGKQKMEHNQIKLLQLSLNMLQSPIVAANDLLGIQP